MSEKSRSRVFREATISYLRNFILDNHINDTSSIALKQTVFDEVALDYRHSYQQPLDEPFKFLGVWIKISSRSTIRGNEAIITIDDPAPELVLIKEKIPTRFYRCGYCRGLIDEFGYVLKREAYEEAKMSVGLETAVCKCCERPVSY
jgi:hypothetical protein